VVDAITIDPKDKRWAAGEVSVKGLSNGTAMGRGPGGSTICDIEIRYSLGRGDSGVYTYSIFDHKAEYPGTQIGEARFAAKLNDEVFDWMTIDANRNKLMPTPDDWDQGNAIEHEGSPPHEHGRLHRAGGTQVRLFGRAVRHSGLRLVEHENHIGFWFINPTIEYLSGGATKVELTGHLDNNEGGAPTLLNYWRGSHYGGTRCEIGQGEAWSKTVGPFLIYCNSAATPNEMWQDRLPGQKGSRPVAI